MYVALTVVLCASVFAHIIGNFAIRGLDFAIFALDLKNEPDGLSSVEAVPKPNGH